MTDCFGAGARLLAGHMARHFGWRPAEFWQATPAELAAVLGRPDAMSRPLDRASLDHLMELENERSG